jgi:hypothetical protein
VPHGTRTAVLVLLFPPVRIPSLPLAPVVAAVGVTHLDDPLAPDRDFVPAVRELDESPPPVAPRRRLLEKPVERVRVYDVVQRRQVRDSPPSASVRTSTTASLGETTLRS